MKKYFAIMLTLIFLFVLNVNIEARNIEVRNVEIPHLLIYENSLFLQFNIHNYFLIRGGVSNKKFDIAVGTQKFINFKVSQQKVNIYPEALIGFNEEFYFQFGMNFPLKYKNNTDFLINLSNRTYLDENLERNHEFLIGFKF